MSMQHPDSILIAELIDRCSKKWPDGSIISRTDTIAVSLSYAELRNIISALQLQSYLRASVNSQASLPV